MDLYQRLKDGKKHEIAEKEYDYHLNVLPPVCFCTDYQGEQWGFGFAEGADTVRLFKKQGQQYFAIETPYINPYEAGSFQSQQKRWMAKWLEIGKKNPWIKGAWEPPFNTQSFTECRTDKVLLEYLARSNWSVGQAFHVGNLCFINQAEGGGEWLTIKDGVAFESISFGAIIRDHGVDAGQKILDDIRAATIEQCIRLEYGR